EIGERAHHEVEAPQGVEARRSQETQMLEAPLRPAAVAAAEIREVAGHALAAPAQVGQEPDAPSRSSQERRLDEVVAQDLAAEWRRAGQDRERAVPDERLEAEDR